MHLSCAIGRLNKTTLRFQTTCSQGLSRVLWKAFLVYDDQMELVFKKVSAS